MISRRSFLKLAANLIYFPLTTSFSFTKIMFLGDSITNGYPYNPVNADVYRRMVLKEFPSLVSVGSMPGDHEGHNGFRTDELIPIAAASCMAYQPDIVFIHAGTNDINQGTEPDLVGLVNTVKNTCPNAIVIVARIIQLNPPSGVITEYNKNYVDTLEDVVIVDLEPVLSPEYLVDKFHPSLSGHAKMAAVISECVKNYVEEK